MSALNTHLEEVKVAFEEEDTLEVTSEEDIFEDIFKEDTPEEVTPEEYTFEEEDTLEEVPPKVHEIKWEKKVHPNGLVEFIADLHDDHRPLSHDYIRVHADLIYSFLREHEDKDVLMSFSCTYRQRVYHFFSDWFDYGQESYTTTSKTNTRFVKLGECEVEEVVSDLLIEISQEAAKDHPVEIDQWDYYRDYTFCLGVTRFSIIFKLK